MKATIDYKGAEFKLDSETLEVRDARTGRCGNTVSCCLAKRLLSTKGVRFEYAKGE